MVIDDLINKISLHRRSFLITASGFVGGLAALGGYARYFEPYALSIDRHTLSFKNLPAAFSDLSIALLSDFHYSSLIDEDYIVRVITKTNNLKPDLILLLGDYVYEELDHAKPIIKMLSDLKANIGVYAVLGNHDHWLSSKLIRSEMKASGLKDITEKGIKIEKEGSHIWLIGAGDLWEEPSNPTTLLSRYNKDEFRIVLSHNPEWAEGIGEGMADLVVSGHTHGGQIRAPLYGALILPTRYGKKYEIGLVRQHDFWVYINRGIGMISPPVRFNCSPEITLMTLKQG